MNPGTNELVIQGRFDGGRFVPLLASEQQTLLVESHPTLLLTAQGKARRITPNDGELQPQFTNARVYVLGKDGELTWSVRKLDVLEATGFSVANASYRYYLPENGGPVVEATYAVNNQGTPEIGFAVPGTPTYLEVNGQPQVLYKSPEGKLLAQVPQGQSSVMLQYRPDRKAGIVFATIGEQLVKPEAVLTNVSVGLLAPAKWKLLFGAGLAGGGSDFDAWTSLFALLFGALAFLFAGFWKFGRRQRWAFAVAVGGLCLFVPAFFGVFFAAAVAAVVVRYRKALWKYFYGKPVRAVVVALVVLVPLGITVLVSSEALIGTSRNMVAKKISNAEYLYEKAPGAPARSAGAFGGGRGADAGDDEAVESSTDGARGEQGDTTADASGYQGLPARIDIPSDVSSTYFHQSMVDRNGRVTLRAWLVSQSVLGALALLCFAVAGLLLFRRRDKVWAWTWAGR